MLVDALESAIEEILGGPVPRLGHVGAGVSLEQRVGRDDGARRLTKSWMTQPPPASATLAKRSPGVAKALGLPSGAAREFSIGSDMQPATEDVVACPLTAELLFGVVEDQFERHAQDAGAVVSADDSGGQILGGGCDRSREVPSAS